jgi:DNA-directed RNA polymerase subunit RPC12/RpoP
MMLKMKCPRCRKRIEFVDAQSGHTVFCPQCNKEVLLKVPRSMYFKLIVGTLLFAGIVGGGGFAAYTLMPGVKKTAQSVWRGIVGMFDPVGASRGRGR